MGGRKAVDAVEAAMIATDVYLDTYSTLIGEAMVIGSPDIDTAAADGAVTDALEAWRPGSATPVVAAAHRVIGNHGQHVRDVLAGRSFGLNDVTARRFQQQLDGVAVVADDQFASAAFAEQNELDAALTGLETARRDLAARTRELEVAVDNGDTTAVMTLRTVVQIDLPARSAEFTKTVLTLTLARAELGRTIASRRRARSAAVVDGLTAELTATEGRILELRQALQQAVLNRSNADTALAAVDRDIADTTRERDSHDVQHAQQQRAALRQLAGLPAESQQLTHAGAR